ncbi:MAG TPA: hypothetical protein DEG17_11580 [Cyanobacteria bacterium UBA11149]|nr:hypothetical protein [Cyanobacteria bacterium UBA11367]HBE58854.1 hypothetical protein [Cyanobacteria bacterium UBA11366]HBK66048.1 hypothetical protein [Cyanobacteria bacterium UBA11166]HBR74438.1 hypothetical protein [Cyanobacteria bacterium UBA11159]HBS68974.1 hypothetical protein [Cyanobacteria bacterium UBA11153]HBW89488.1 hypothetical protein [Cyanobacteria bacterium UBA11149]HCA93364.1 hypothetical protein [Cyanobacteria bacterium UBA9226]
MANTYKSGYLALNKTEARKNWYSQVAHTYNKVRPHYPQELISHGIAIAKLPPDGIILEIGSGPGTATTAFAKIGLTMVCLEPNPIAYQLAKQNCAIYPKIECSQAASPG